MGQTKKCTVGYESPDVECQDVVIESGFAASDSPLRYDATPAMDYGDESEQWFS